MFADQTAVMIFFRILNFAVLIAVGWYVGKKYIISMVQTKIAERQSRLKNLGQEYVQLKLKQRSLDQYMMEQEKLTQALISKAQRWKLLVDEYHVRRQAEGLQLKKEVERRMTVRTEQAAFMALQHEVVPRALMQAEQELTAYFSQEKHGRLFIDALVHKVERENRG